MLVFLYKCGNRVNSYLQDTEVLSTSRLTVFPLLNKRLFQINGRFTFSFVC